uniref:Jupiter microtubule associated homolog 2 n=1 Tax=Cyprinus carpio TaxID=7962 RepID=A0A8C2DCM0_CYPCA
MYKRASHVIIFAVLPYMHRSCPGLSGRGRSDLKVFFWHTQSCSLSVWQDASAVVEFTGSRRSRPRQAAMTTTNMFQGLDSSGKPSSRVLRPPGGGSSNLFGGYEEDTSASRRPNKMSSSIFSPQESTGAQGSPKRSNPPGGKSSGIFGEPGAPSTQSKPVPPGGAASNIFGGAESTPPSVKSQHPNKPKDNLSVGVPATPDPPAPVPKMTVVEEVKAEPVPPQPTPEKQPAAPAPAANQNSEPATQQPTEKDHEPRLGPRPRSHNKVLNPPESLLLSLQKLDGYVCFQMVCIDGCFSI